MSNSNLLSIIINGRNDNYNPYFISRLNFVIEHTFYIAKNLGIQNEIQFCCIDCRNHKSLILVIMDKFFLFLFKSIIFILFDL